MISDSPADALGAHASGIRELLVQVVRSRHGRSADAHEASGSRYAMGFGSQWRDLLDDTHDEVTKHGFQSHKLAPGGHKVPVVNGCLLYVWRVPDNPDAVSNFAASPTRLAGFLATPPQAMLFEPTFSKTSEPVEDAPDTAEIASMLGALHDTMPLVLVMVWSTPRQLQSIEWAVAVLDDAGKVQLRGQECIWEPELVDAAVVSDVESFDSGIPVTPTVELQKQEETRPDA